jgi:hypothetical protein
VRAIGGKLPKSGECLSEGIENLETYRIYSKKMHQCIVKAPFPGKFSVFICIVNSRQTILSASEGLCLQGGFENEALISIFAEL